MEYLVIEVLHKPSKEKRFIKYKQFNPEIHEKIGDVFPASRMDYSKPVNIKLDPVQQAVLNGIAKKDKKIVEVQTQKEDNGSEVKIDEELTRNELLKLCKEKGLNPSNKSTKQDLLAQVRANNN